MFSATLIASAPGMCPTWSWIPEPLMPTPVVDFVLSGEGGTLEVEVVREGKSAAGVPVAVSLERAELREVWAAGGDSPERKAVEQAARPVAKTDAKGIARFEKLIPGNYQIIAGEVEPAAVRYLRERWRRDATDATAFGEADGVSVPRGAVTRRRMTIYPQNAQAHYQVLGRDGKPLAGETVGTDYSRIKEGGAATASRLDAQGMATFSGEGAGLWYLSLKHCDMPIRWFPVESPPYDEAKAVVAVSPLLRSQRPARLTLLHVVPAKATVKLLDAAGKPVRGTVEIGRFGDPVMIGSTDAGGSVRFEGLRNWKCPVRGYAAGLAPTEYGDRDSPLPDDATLQAGYALLVESIASLPNTDATLVLKAQPVGYVRGRLKPPAEKMPSNYEIAVDREAAERRASRHYQPATGEFVAGPFPPGKTTLRVIDYATNREIDQQEVTIAAGQVTAVELHPAPTPAAQPRQPKTMLFGVGGLVGWPGSGMDALCGAVKMSDGRTPADGALVYYYDPVGFQFSAAGIADPAGNIQAHDRMVYTDDEPARAGDPKGPVIVAALPAPAGR